MPSSRGPSQPRDQNQVYCIAGRFFTIWATREEFTRLQRLLDFFLGSSWSQKKRLSHFHLSTLSWCLVGCLPNGNFSHSERPYYILQVILFFLVSTLIYFSGLRVKSKVILSKIFIYLETEFYLTLKHMIRIVFWAIPKYKICKMLCISHLLMSDSLQFHEL